MLLYRGEQRFDLKLAPAKLPLILQGQEQLIVQASAKAKPSNWRYAGELRQMVTVPFVGKTIVRNFPINFDERIFIDLDPIQPSFFEFAPPNWLKIRVTISIFDLLSPPDP
jgi:hypothetical protein